MTSKSVIRLFRREIKMFELEWLGLKTNSSTRRDKTRKIVQPTPVNQGKIKLQHIDVAVKQLVAL
jgi:hypothetical protein